MIDELAEGLEKLAEAMQPPTPDINAVPNPSGHGSVAVVRDGYKVERLPGPMKKQRCHIFHDLRSLAEWLNRHAADSIEAVEILAGETAVEAALSPAALGGDLLRCNLKFHPAFDAWRGIFGKKLSQKQLHAFVRGNANSLPTGGDVFAGELRSMQAVKGAEFKAELDERGFYRVASATARADVQGKIPSNFKIEVPIYIGVCHPNEIVERVYNIDVMLSMEVEEAGVSFMLECPELPVTLHNARLDAVEWLKSLLSKGFLVGLGDLKLQDVPFIEAAK